MRNLLSSIILVIVTALLVSTAAARDLYVDNLAGDDNFSGGYATPLASGHGPLKTITRALRIAGTGDRIILAKNDAPYYESISLVGTRHSGDSFMPFTIVGNGATLDGSAPVPLDAWEHWQDGVFRFRPPALDHQQLFLDNVPLSRVTADRLASAPPELEPLEWCVYGGAIYLRTEPMKMPIDYRLSYAREQAGITLFHVTKVQIVDLVVQGFQLDGINAFNSASGVVLDSVICRGNGRSGIAIGGASHVNVDGCLLGDNGRAQLLTFPLSVAHIRATNLISNTAPGWIDNGGRVYIDGQPSQGGLDAETDTEI